MVYKWYINGIYIYGIYIYMNDHLHAKGAVSTTDPLHGMHIQVGSRSQGSRQNSPQRQTRMMENHRKTIGKP